MPPSPSKLKATNADIFTVALADSVATMFVPGSTTIFSELLIVPAHTNVPAVLSFSTHSKFPSTAIKLNVLAVVLYCRRKILAPNLGVFLNTIAPALAVPVIVATVIEAE